MNIHLGILTYLNGWGARKSHINPGITYYYTFVALYPVLVLVVIKTFESFEGFI